MDWMDKIRKLQALYDDGVITQEEFDKQRALLLPSEEGKKAEENEKTRAEEASAERKEEGKEVPWRVGILFAVLSIISLLLPWVDVASSASVGSHVASSSMKVIGIVTWFGNLSLCISSALIYYSYKNKGYSVRLIALLGILFGVYVIWYLQNHYSASSSASYRGIHASSKIAAMPASGLYLYLVCVTLLTIFASRQLEIHNQQEAPVVAGAFQAILSKTRALSDHGRKPLPVITRFFSNLVEAIASVVRRPKMLAALFAVCGVLGGAVVAFQYVSKNKEQALMEQGGVGETKKRMPKQELKMVPEKEQPAVTDSSYLTIPCTSEKAYAMSKMQRVLARNEIYARHGRAFQTPWIRAYFTSQSWYVEDPNFTTRMLSAEDKKCLGYIRKWEKEFGKYLGDGKEGLGQVGLSTTVEQRQGTTSSQWSSLRYSKRLDLNISASEGPFWVVSISAGKNKAAAEKKAQDLQEQGWAAHTAYLGDYGSAKNKPYWLVYIGPYAYKDRGAAKKMMRKVRRQLNPKSYAVTLGHRGQRESMK